MFEEGVALLLFKQVIKLLNFLSGFLPEARIFNFKKLMDALPVQFRALLLLLGDSFDQVGFVIDRPPSKRELHEVVVAPGRPQIEVLTLPRDPFFEFSAFFTGFFFFITVFSSGNVHLSGNLIRNFCWLVGT